MKQAFFCSVFMFCFLIGFAQTDVDKMLQLKELGDSLVSNRNAKDALTAYLEAEQLANNETDDLLLNSIYYNIGLQFYELGDNKNAITYYKKSEILSKQMQNDSCYVMALHGIGLSYSSRLYYDNAIDYYTRALNIQREKVQDARTEAVILNGLVGVYIKKGDYENTLKFSQRALSKIKETEDIELQANILNTIGICYEEQKDYKSSLSYKKQSLELCKKHNLLPPIPLLANIGKNFQLLKQPDSALYYYNIAKKAALSVKSDYAIARIDYRIGKTYAEELNNYKKGLNHLTKSHAFFSKIGDQQMLNVSSKTLSEVYTKLNNPSKALTFLKEHIQWTDSLNIRSANKKLEEYNIKYKTAEKEKEIVLLDKDNLIKTTLIAEEQKEKRLLWIIFSSLVVLVSLGAWFWYRINKKRILEKENNLLFKSVLETEQKERKRIAQDLHDSIGQSISVVKMQTNALVSTSDEEALKHKKLLNHVDYVYDELRDISHNIMPNTLITLGLVPALKELITEINTADSLKIEFKSNADFKELNETQSINVFRIIQEALANTIKHAKASLINIDLIRKDTNASISIKDNGIGIHPSKIDNSEGIGWKNIISRVSLLAGDIDINSQPDKGTSITIQFKPQLLQSV